MNGWKKEFKLLGAHCIINIAQKNPVPGLAVLSSDPRKWRIKLDAYVGTVEDVGTGCTLVKPGDKIVVERWEYKQHDIDEERIVATEHQVMILGNGQPAPGVVVMRLFPQTPKTRLTLPDSVLRTERKKTMLYCGRVLASSSKTVRPGDIAWVEKRERHQYQMADGRFVFVNCQDSWGEFPIWMIGERVEVKKEAEVLK